MSQLFQLNHNDWLKGLLTSVVSAVLMLIIQLLQTNTPFDWRAIGVTALVTGLSYIVKQLGTDHQGKILGKVDLHSKP